MSDAWEEKSPAIQLYVRDWLTDVALRSCSDAARGVWADALCLMQLAPVRGKLEAETREDLCMILGGTLETKSDKIDELIRKKVASSDGPGSLINRRMFHASKVSASRSNAGKIGAASRWQNKSHMRTPCEPLDKCHSDNAPENGTTLSPSELCHSKPDGKNMAEMATPSSSSSSVHSTKRESTSTSRAREAPAARSLSENFDGRIFDLETFDARSGRCALKRFKFVYLTSAELLEAKKIWCESNALTQEEWRTGMHRLNAYCEPKQHTAEFKRGLAYKQLLGIILTDALAQRKNKKDPRTNGTHPPKGRAYQTYKRPERSGVPEQIGDVMRRAQTATTEGATHGKKSE